MNLEAFDRDGIVFPAGSIDARGFADRYRAFQAASNRSRGKDTNIKPHLVSPWLWEVVHAPAIVDAVEQALGPDIILWESDWSVKRAGTGDWVPWHQDSPYWNLSTDEVVSVWLAVSDVTVDNGAMQVVLGSHASGRIGGVDVAGDLSDAFTEGQRTTDDDCMFPFHHLTEDHDGGAVSVELMSGEFSIHSVNLVHGGGPNPADKDRIGFAMRYISADTRYLGALDSVTTIRGDCMREHFVYEPEPSGEFSPNALAALEYALTFPSGFGEAKRKR